MTTKDSAEFRILKYLDERYECFEITDNALRVAMFDIADSEYFEKLEVMKGPDATIGKKDRVPFNWTITKNGQKRLAQMRKVVENENRKERPFKERFFWVITIGGFVVTYVAGIFSPVLTEMAKSKLLKAAPKSQVVFLLDAENVARTFSISSQDFYEQQVH